MEEQINEQMIGLVFRGVSFTANVLGSALRKLAEAKEKHDQAKLAKELNEDPYVHGCQTVEELMQQNAGAELLDIGNEGVRRFDRYARRYHVDYAITSRDVDGTKQFQVFFKGRDSGAMQAAFRDFVNDNEKRKEKKLLKERIQESKAKVKDLNSKEKTKKKDRKIKKERKKAEPVR